MAQVEVWRGSRKESEHGFDAVVLGADGAMTAAYGDPDRRTFWRSAAKPIQVIPFVEAGGMEHFGLDDEALALMCASHGGEARHVAKVRDLLGRIGLDEEALECGAARPMFEGAYRELIMHGESSKAVHNPCSGKHSAMLAMIRLRGWDKEGYTHPSHPVQQLILKTVAETAGIGIDEIDIAIDGCGVPVFGLPIRNMATAYRALAHPDAPPALKRIARAMADHPFFVAGTRRLDTILMEETRGTLVAKLGAEAVYCIGRIGMGEALAVKIADGGYRALDPLIPALLHRHGFIDAEVRTRIESRLRLSITNHRGEVIGHYRVDWD